MIYYQLGWANLFKVRGSVFPRASKAAVPSAIFSALLRWMINEGYLAFMEGDDSILSQTQAWAGFSVLVGFLIIFRSSQAYSRFWDGCTATHHMRADWFDAASALIAFTEDSKAPVEQVAKFKHTVIRLVSMMHSAAFMDLEEMNNKWGTTSDVKADVYELLDPLGIDETTLHTLYESKDKVMLIFQWLQLLIVRNMNCGVLNVPPPILSRAYNELANGMVAFHECVKISDTPFPFPYAQNCDLLLLLHWVLVPFVVSQWVTQPFWSFIFVFMQVFVLWSLNYIAIEIENPFGTDDNAIDGHHMQEEMNRHLKMLVDQKSHRSPTLSDQAVFSVEPAELPWEEAGKSFKDIWKYKKKEGKKKHRLASSSCSSTGGSSEASTTATESEPPSRLREGAQAARMRGGSGAQKSSSGGSVEPVAGKGGHHSWAIVVEEGRDAGSQKEQLYDGGPGGGFDARSYGGQWEALPHKDRPMAHSHSAPPKGQRYSDEFSSGSGSEGGGRHRGRSGSRRRQQRRGKRRV